MNIRCWLLSIAFFLCYLPSIVAQGVKKEFTFSFEGVTLHGVINLPFSDSPKGMVLFVHGSGRTNAVSGNMYGDIRAAIIDAGYATFIYDKMGCGKSEGTFDYNQSVQSSTREVLVAIDALQQDSIPGADKIGFWGISRAGWIIPIVINQYPKSQFWISASGVDEKENFNYLFAQNMRIAGYPQDSIELIISEFREGVKICHEGGSFGAYMEATKHVHNVPFLQRFNNNREITEEGYYEYQKEFMKESFDSDAGLQIYVDDFEEMLSNVRCPVLALFGGKDMNVDWRKTKALYERTLAKNRNLTIKSFSNCNHNLYSCSTGGFYEFQDNNLSLVRCDGLLTTMTEWLNKR